MKSNYQLGSLSASDQKRHDAILRMTLDKVRRAMSASSFISRVGVDDVLERIDAPCGLVAMVATSAKAVLDGTLSEEAAFFGSPTATE